MWKCMKHKVTNNLKSSEWISWTIYIYIFIYMYILFFKCSLTRAIWSMSRTTIDDKLAADVVADMWQFLRINKSATKMKTGCSIREILLPEHGTRFDAHFRTKRKTNSPFSQKTDTSLAFHTKLFFQPSLLSIAPRNVWTKNHARWNRKYHAAS